MKFIDRMADMLVGRVRTDAVGAKSLAHVCVVVPTAQSGRRLRLALAERLGALVPPLVKTPTGMMLDENDRTVATRTEEIVAFKTALLESGKGSLASDPLEGARILADLRGVLSAKALSFSDVASLIAEDLPEEAERWRELAEIEKRYLSALSSRGKRDRISAMKGHSPDLSGVEEVIRAEELMLAERPADGSPCLLREQIYPCATPSDEAARIADYFAAVPKDRALPSLCVADPEMFTEIETAFRARGLKVHNPARMRLVTSSLGHLVAQIASLRESSSYSVFSAFIRGGDVRRWLASELKLTDAEYSAALVDLDNRQTEYLPEKIDDIASKTSGRLRAIFELVKARLRKRSFRSLLGEIFSLRTLSPENAGDREFAAAAEVVATLVDECGDDAALLSLRLDEATYGLEPDEGEIILTDGWMELPFIAADELVIAGFQEGCVPESVVGHPYLPDSLRRRLGLPDNLYKERRDRAILDTAVRARARDAVKVFFHSVDAKGDVLKPSRLLFETPDDADLVSRVRAFFGVRAGTSSSSASDLPEAWRLRLPVPPRERKLVKISPTRLDGYLRCPFTFYLRDKAILGDKPLDDRAEELKSWEYGNLAHESLEAFGLSQIRDSDDERQIADFLSEQVDARLVDRFATSIPAIVSLQGESVKRRLAHFAAIQAARRREGWSIVAVERKLAIQYGETRLYGKCDRIDFNEATGEWCVIDYKTWDSAVRAASFDTKRDGTRIWRSLQLPLYCAMLDMDGEEPFAAAKLDVISACYCVLGKTADDVVFTEPMRGAYVPEAEAVVLSLIPKIERGIFWPPSPAREWKYDFEKWLSPAPEMTVDPKWIADQEARIRDFAEKGETQ